MPIKQNIKRIGIIGGGSVAGRFVEGLAGYQRETASPEFEITAVADITPDNRLAKVLPDTRYFKLPLRWAECPNPNSMPGEMVALLKEVDAVYIASTNCTHRGYLLCAVRADKHVLVTKPLTHTHAEARKLVDELKSIEPAVSCGPGQDFSRSSVNVMYEDHYLYSGIIVDLLTGSLNANPFADLGEIRRVSGFLNEKKGSDRSEPERIGWLLDPELSGGGLWIDLGVHLSICLRKLGADFEVVSARPKIGAGFISEMQMILHGFLHQNGARDDIPWQRTPCALMVQKEAHKARKELVFHFEKGIVTVDFLSRKIWRYTGADGEMVCHENPVNPYRKLAEVFVKLIDGREDNRIASLEDALEEMALVKKAYALSHLTDKYENWIDPIR